MKRRIALATIVVCIALTIGCTGTSALSTAQGLPASTGNQYLSGKQVLDGAGSTQFPLAATDSNTAMIVGWGDSMAEGLKSALSYGRGVRVTTLYVLRADGKKVSRKNGSTTLTAGRHQLIVQCVLYVGGMSWDSSPSLNVELEAGRVYELQAHNEAQNCVPYLRDRQ